MTRTLLDFGSTLTLLLTLALFVVALFVKGFTHDLLLEAGVFLVSAKLVLMGYRNVLATEEIRAEIRALRARLPDRGAGAGGPGEAAP